MNYFYLKRSLLMSILTIGFLSLFSFIAIGQTTVQIGTGTSSPSNTLYGPIYRYSATSATTGASANMLFTAAELSAAGINPGDVITEVEFNKTTASYFNNGTGIPFTMRMGNTTNAGPLTGTIASEWSNIVATQNIVFNDANFNVPQTTGWMTIVLDNPFTYNGGSIELSTEHTMPGGGGATGNIAWEYTTGVSDYLIGEASGGGSNISGYKQRPNIKITFTPGVACSGTPTAGTAAGPSLVCASEQFDISISGQSIASDLEYQWLSAPSATGPWTPVTGATSSSETVSQTTDTYYACELTCTNSNLSDTSSTIFVQTSPNLAAGTYTIGATGDYATISEAVDAMSCGIAGPVQFDVIAGSGPYNEQVVIPEIINSSATNTVTFNGNGETVSSTTTSGDRSLFLLDGADYVTIDSFNLVTQSTTNNFVIQLTNDADHNTISNNVLDLSTAMSSTSSSNAGIVISGSLTSATSSTGTSGTDNTITGNTIIGGYYSITINGQSSTYSENNIISDNSLEDFRMYGMYLRYNVDTEVTENDISRPTRDNVSTLYGMYFVSGGEGHTVSGNHIHDVFGGITSNSTSSTYAIYHSGQDSPLSNPSLVYNNIINISGNLNYSHNGTIYALYNSNSDGVHYYHNTISLDDEGSTSGTTRGFYQTSTASDIEFKNNIVNITRAGSGTKYCLYFNASGSTIDSDYNVLFMNSPAGTNNIGYSGGAQSTLTNWQTATSGDANSVDFDPLLVNAANIHQLPTNPLVNDIGTPIAGITTDFGGNTRDVNTPDPGAHEFIPPTCPQPAALNAINVTSTSLDFEWVETGSATAWNIEWGLSGFVLGAGTPLQATTNPQPFTNLNASTQYDFYVQSDCGGGDLSTWAGPFTIYTSCGVVVAPYYEGFNNGVEPQCWENLTTGTSSANNYWKFESGVAYGAANNGKPTGTYAWTDGSSPTPDSVMLITPEIDISALTTPYLSFEWFSNNTDNPGDNVPLIIEVFDGSSWNLLDTLMGDSTEWLFVNYDLSAFSNNTIKVRFMTNQVFPNTLAQYNDILLDEVRIDDCISLGGQDGTLDVCRLDGSVDLEDNIITKPNGGGVWSFPTEPEYLVNDTIINISLLPSGSYEAYYVERFVCYDTTVATINVFNPSSAGISGSDTVCKNEPINLYETLDGNADLGGDWYDFTNTLLPNSQPKAQAIPGEYNYTYVADNGVCPADTAVVTISVKAECDFLSVSNEEFDQMSVYPNPATTQLNIVNPSNASSLKIEMLDMNGRTVLVENKALNNASEATLAIEHLEKGVYTLRVYNEEGQKTFKVVKQ